MPPIQFLYSCELLASTQNFSILLAASFSFPLAKLANKTALSAPPEIPDTASYWYSDDERFELKIPERAPAW